jgi:phage-related protein
VDKMTPQEIADYKRAWLMTDSNDVRIHSDLRDQAKDWCKENLNKWEWSWNAYSNVYEDTFLFEDKFASDSFKERFKEWVDL